MGLNQFYQSALEDRIQFLKKKHTEFEMFIFEILFNLNIIKIKFNKALRHTNKHRGVYSDCP